MTKQSIIEIKFAKDLRELLKDEKVSMSETARQKIEKFSNDDLLYVRIDLKPQISDIKLFNSEKYIFKKVSE